MFFSKRKLVDMDHANANSIIIERLLQSAFLEQRRSRRWSIFFRLVFVAYFTLFLIMLMPLLGGTMPDKTGAPHTAVINIDGVISAQSPAQAALINKSLDEAFENPLAKGIILSINSPGGSPVQADLIYSKLVSLRKKNPEKPVMAVVADIGASAAYYIAAGADEIYSNPSSLVGSIGVLYDGFGFVDTMKKLGVERRMYTAGNQKGMFDPFQPLPADEVKYMKSMLNDLHEQFIGRVKAGRGDRLDAKQKDLFSGKAWTGVRAKEIGLIDGFGSVEDVSRAVFAQDKLVDYTQSRGFLAELTGQAGTELSSAVTNFSLPKVQFIWQ